MEITIVLIGLLCLAISLNKYKSWNNPYSIFNILWIFVCVMIGIGNQFVYHPSSTAMLIVLTGFLAFNLSMFSPRFVIGSRRLAEEETPKSYAFDTALIYKLSWIVLFLSILIAIESIRSILSGANFSTVREEYYNISSSGSTYIYYLRNYFVSPMRYVITIATIMAFYNKDRYKVGLLINTILLVLLQAVTSGGRYILMNTFFMLLCGLMLFGKNIKLGVRQKIIFVILSVTLMYGIIYLTNDRSTYQTADMSTWERLITTIYQYFAGSVTYLGQLIETSPEVVGTTHGVNAIAGFLSPFFAVLTFTHILSYPKVFNVIGTYATQVLKIGSRTYYNAMPTIFGYFYIDGGLILTFIEAFIFGYVCKRLYERAADGEMLFIAWYMLIFIQICNASTRWFVFSSDYCLAFLYLPILMRKILGGGTSYLKK